MKRTREPQVVGIGRREANILEPTQCSVKRIYRVQWKRTSINQDELAKLYWNNGLTVTEIATKLGLARTTVHDYVQRMIATKAQEERKNGTC